jgi:hypothetical protein
MAKPLLVFFEELLKAYWQKLFVYHLEIYYIKEFQLARRARRDISSLSTKP